LDFEGGAAPDVLDEYGQTVVAERDASLVSSEGGRDAIPNEENRLPLRANVGLGRSGDSRRHPDETIGSDRQNAGHDGHGEGAPSGERFRQRRDEAQHIGHVAAAAGWRGGWIAR
jgi:hypothetical protein